MLVLLITTGLAAALLPQQIVFSAAPGQELQPTPTPVTDVEVIPAEEVVPAALPAADPEDTVSFGVLGLSEVYLYGPYDALRVRFSLPPTWELGEGAELRLVMSASVINEGVANAPLYTGGAIAGSLDVTFNGQLISSLALQSGRNVLYQVSIPVDALVPVRSDGRHELYLFLNAGIDCDLDFHRTTLLISPESALILPHELVSPPVSLAQLPKPFYAQGLFLIDPAAIIVPDAPSAAELQAALTVAASFGRLTAGNLPLTLLPQGRLSEVQETANLIFVGKSSELQGLPTIREAVPPIAQAEDGVLQIALSPWNPARVLLTVTGETDAGVVKAAQALSTGRLQTGDETDLAVIADVRSDLAVGEIPATDRSFADLGAEVQTITGIGTNDLFFSFYIPPGQVANPDAYLDLVYTHSDLVDYGRSGAIIFLNGQPLGSVRLNDENSRLTTERFSIPASLLLPGDNQLVVQAELAPLDECTAFDWDSMWFTIFPDSLLHIPLSPAPFVTNLLRDLGVYPYPFVGDPTLGSLAFIVPQGDLLAWQTAARIAFGMSNRANGALYQLSVAFADQAPEDLLRTRDLILVGQPDQLPLLQELNDELPAPFEAGSNLAVERDSQVLYRIPVGTSLGYLQLVPSKWSSTNTVLAVLGSTPQGLTWAGDALIVGTLRSKLNGDFAVVQGEQVLSSDSRRSAGTGNLAATLAPTAGVVVEPEAAPTITPIPVQPASPGAQPPAPDNNWILPVVIGLGALMVIVLGVAIVSGLRSGGGR
jgi:hypothetical protein